MRLVLQRVSQAAVTIEHGERREIGPGLVIFAGICAQDNQKISAYMANKAVNLRIFDDDHGQMNRSLLDIGGSCLLVSQFTLYANSRKGRRPSFVDAAPPDIAEPLYEHLIAAFKQAGVAELKTGEFGAHMDVALVNDGPVTILLDSDDIMPESERNSPGQ